MHQPYYNSTRTPAITQTISEHMLKNIRTYSVELLYFNFLCFCTNMRILYVYFGVPRCLRLIYLTQGVGSISHWLCVLHNVLQHIEPASPPWILLGHNCLYPLTERANNNPHISISIMATPRSPQLCDSLSNSGVGMETWLYQGIEMEEPMFL